MDVIQFINQLKDNRRELPLHFDKKKLQGLSLMTQVHSRGVRPKYYINKQNSTEFGKLIEPVDYDKRYDDIFDFHLLVRHPNETHESYNYRLSVYSPIQAELYERFFNTLAGSILNTNNYSVKSSIDTVDAYIKEISIYDVFRNDLDFILNNPRGFMSVIQTNIGLSENELTKPVGINLEPDSIIMYNGVSCAFEYLGVYYFLDRNYQHTIISRGKEYILIDSYNHGFGEIPFWGLDSNFLGSYVKWSEELIRNLSDDQVVVKNYSYPEKQVVAPECKKCNGTGKCKSDNPEYYDKVVTCGDCKGRGYVSFNIGEFYTIGEEDLKRDYNGKMPEMAKYINPEVGIAEYHFERWQKFYKYAENALNLTKRTTSGESGEAKREDRKDQYFWYHTISQYLFEQERKKFKYIGLYLNTEIEDGEVIHSDGGVVIKEPRQFDLMTEMDLIEEVKEVSEGTDNQMILSELSYNANQKVFEGNPVMQKIDTVMYLSDPLYGLSKENEKQKLLSGSYTEKDKYTHTKGYHLLKEYAMQIGDDFIDIEISELKDWISDKIEEILPNTMPDIEFPTLSDN